MYTILCLQCLGFLMIVSEFEEDEASEPRKVKQTTEGPK